MTWGPLVGAGATVRPFDGVPPPERGRRSPFSAPVKTTIRDLARELRALDAKNVVVELAIREQDLRLDGLPRANARQPEHPAVAVSFGSTHGPLRYATADYATWEDNLRAIVLTMEALRAVDRHGVAKRGEQYQGWRAIPRSTDPADAIQTREQAERVLAELSGLAGQPATAQAREALRRTHPDRGGDATAFRVAMRAKELLGA